MRKYVLAIDPSGSFDQGKGRSGFCLCDIETYKIISVWELDSAEFEKAEEYWFNHIEQIVGTMAKYQIAPTNISIVIEEYILYANKATAQINSKFETSQLIGILRNFLWQNKIPITMQMAGLVKNRWSNKLLIAKEILYQAKSNKLCLAGTTQSTSQHERDAIRHALHYAHFDKHNKRRKK